MVKFLIEFSKWSSIKVLVKFITKWNTMVELPTAYLCLPLHLFFARFSLPYARFKLSKRNFLCNFGVLFVFFSSPLMVHCEFWYDSGHRQHRTWWQWFTDFTAIFAHQHINYTFNAVQSNSIIKIKASDKSLAVKQL